MPRPRKCRRVCSHPKFTTFTSCEEPGQAITMTVDEFEVIRLIDFEGLTQEQCAGQMEVARTTVQAIYASARKKLAQYIVQGHSLHISGGDVHFCEHRNHSCDKGCCKWKNDEITMKRR